MLTSSGDRMALVFSSPLDKALAGDQTDASHLRAEARMVHTDDRDYLVTVTLELVGQRDLNAQSVGSGSLAATGSRRDAVWAGDFRRMQSATGPCDGARSTPVGRFRVSNMRRRSAS
jgi:hypothetical protein